MDTKQLSDRLKYFLSAWGMNGVGSTVAKVQDSPDTVSTLTVNDLSTLLSVIEPDAPVAPAAAINLEGLRKKLLTPRQIVRDEDGYLTHSDFPICDEGTHAGKFLDAFGIDAEFVAMESDDPAAAERYFEAGEAHCSYWTPTPPDGEGWLLLEIYETEDGPCALFGRDRYEHENALKRQRMRVQLDRIKQRQATQGENQ